MKTEVPDIKIDSVRKIFDDGNHNAFTDMCEFKGAMYIAFRSSPSGHDIKDDSSIVVISSRDGKEWKKVYSFKIPKRDPRDPHFLIFKGKLFIFAASWYCDPDSAQKSTMKDHLGYAVFSEDGDTWSEPKALEGTKGYFIWRVASFGDKAYMCGRCIARDDMPDGTPAIRHSVLLESSDGFSWKPAGLFQEKNGNETAFLFEKDGSILALARYTSEESQLCRSKAPYKEWDRKKISRFIGGPLIVKWGKHYLVGGRKFINRENPKTVLSWLVDDQLVDMAELPSGGDNSYPGFLPLSGKHGLISYYSSHEGSNSKVAPCSIYLAEISLK